MSANEIPEALYAALPDAYDSLRAVLEREKTLAPTKAPELACDVADFGVAKAITQAGGDKITRTGTR